MNAVPFVAKGETSEWRKVYDFIPKEVGSIVTYESLDALLGRDFRSQRGPVYRAMRQMEEDDQRTLAIEQGVGYRVARADEHEGLGQRHRIKSMRQLGRSRRRFASADRSQLAPEAVARLDALESTVSKLQHRVRYLEVRDEEKAEAIKAVATKSSVTVERLERLEEALKKHGMI